jgi:hypothetical protein
VGLAVDEWVLHSGGAVGADSVFGMHAEQYGITEQHYSYRGHENCRSRGRVILSEEQLAAADPDLLSVLSPTVSAVDQRREPVWRFWQRDWYQVLHTDEVFVVTKDIDRFLDLSGPPAEGAAVAVAVAIQRRQRCQRVFAFDQGKKRWFRWLRDEAVLDPADALAAFEPVDDGGVHIRGKDFTGIGTRTINEPGIKAITDLFTRSFPGR